MGPLRWRRLLRTTDDSGLRRYRQEGRRIFLDVRLHQWQQLFNFRDPAPFRDRDLDDDAVTYIVSSFRDIQGADDVTLVLHLAEAREISAAPEGLADAVHAYFGHERLLASSRRRQSLRRGRAALVIGAVFLVLCTSLARWTAQFDLGLASLPLREGLTILGWAALWRPIDILLYDWWPIADDLEVYEKLSRVPVEVLYGVRPADVETSTESRQTKA